MGSELQITLFGMPNFHQPGMPDLQISSRKAIALLAFLVTTREVHSRESLAEMLWEGRSQTQSLANLRVLLTRLRQTMGDYLIITRESVAFNLDCKTWIDVNQFEEHLTAAARFETEFGSNSPKVRDEIKQAIDLYTTDFLEGFYVRNSPAFEAWVRVERERLRRLSLQGLRKLAAWFQTHEEYVSGIQFTRQWLELDPLSESAHRELMRLYALNGQRSTALRQYETCKHVLVAELNAEPSANTQALHEKIRMGKIGSEEKITGPIEMPDETSRGYQLGDLIGRGALGAVYQARQMHTEREVAIKVILPHYANHPDFIRRFDLEARRVARLEHLHIVPLYDYWREPSSAKLVMRLMRGGNLAARITDGSLNLEETSLLVDQVCDALSVAHQRGIVHGNLKPTNILFGDTGNAYLSDFGIAGILPAAYQPGEIIYSPYDPYYLAPEQIRAEPITSLADIYSLGVMLFEILSGVHPFAQTNPSEVPGRHLHDPLPALQTNNPGLSAALDQILQRACAKAPAERYLDIQELAADFQQAVEPHLIQTRAPITTLVEKEIYNPYKGLRTFQEADASDFFGRERSTEKLLNRLGEDTPARRFLAVVGPSGCGKSSLVRAGLIPALREGAFPGSQDWYFIDMMPGTQPMEALETALLGVATTPPPNLLSQLKQDNRGLSRAIKRILPNRLNAAENHAGNLLLFIDQFEEVFTRVEDEATRLQFLESLQEAIVDRYCPLWVVITLRADFYDRPLQYDQFGELLRSRTEVLLPMNSDELVAAIAGPAERAGVRFEDGMAVAIATDVAEQPGALPLLQYALTELFEQRKDRTITQEAYEQIGGVEGALIRRAEETYQSLDLKNQEAAQQLFLRLITLGEDVEDTRRRVLRSELTALQIDPQVMEMTIDSFDRARLLTFDRDPSTRSPTVEIAHEALMREWPRLQEWLDRSRADIRMQRVLANATSEWQAADQDSSFLLRGTRLAQFENWQENSYLALTSAEQRFLDASLDERERRQQAESARQERERALERRSIQRLRIIVAVLVAAIVLGAFLTAAIFWQSQRAQRAADESLSVALATNAEQVFGEGLRDLGITLAMEANKIEDPPLQVQRTLANLAFAPGTRWVRAGYQGKVTALDISPDGRLLIFGHGEPLESTSETEYVLRLWDIESGEELHQYNGHSAPIHTVAFSPDGKTIASGGEDNQLILWQVNSGEQIGSFRIPAVGEAIEKIAFHPYGNSILIQSSNFDPPFVRIFLLDLNNGEVLQWFESEADDIAGLAFSLDGQFFYELSCVINAQCSLTTWEIDSGEQINMLKSFDLTDLEPTSMDLSPDGESAIIGGAQGNVVLMDLDSGDFIHILKVPNVSQPTEAVAFNPNGRTALAGFFNGRVCHYEITSGDEMYCFSGHTDHVWSLAYTPDGTQAVSSSFDGTVRLWDLTSGNEVLRFAPQDVLGFWEIVLSPNGEIAYSGAGAPYFDLPEPEGQAEGIDYVPPVENNAVILWNTASGEEIGRLEGHSHSVWTIALHPESQRLISGARWEGNCLWDLEEQRLLDYIADDDGVTNAVFSQDGSKVLYGSWDGTLHLLDLETMKDIRSWKFQDTGGVSGVAFTNDEEAVFSGLWEGEISLWSLETGQSIHHFTGHTGPVFQIHILPDGERMLSFAADSTARLWDLESGQEIHTFVLDEYGAASAVTSNGRLTLLSSIDVLGNATSLSLWDLESYEKLAQFSQDGIVWNAAFSPDGRYFYTASWDGTVRKWLVPPQDVLELIEWVSANRYISELTAEQRARYLLESN